MPFPNFLSNQWLDVAVVQSYENPMGKLDTRNVLLINMIRKMTKGKSGNMAASIPQNYVPSIESY